MRVVVSPHNVVNAPDVGGHFWVFMQYVQGLRDIGCDVWWMEELSPANSRADAERIGALQDGLERYGLQDRVIIYTAQREFFTLSETRAKAVFRDTDLLLNFHQRIAPWMLGQFRRTALVDIDPGLLQYWISSGLLEVAKHDLYFTTGETVGTPAARFPSCGLDWIAIRPAISLDLWPRIPAPDDAPFTTVSAWWGREWVRENGKVYDNNKRCSFLRFADLPAHTRVPLELALYLDPKSAADDADRTRLVAKGWRVRRSPDVAGNPRQYQQYLQASRGEFSCAKRSCMKYQNAWISDRTLCYLATGRPAVVQDTGPSAILPNGLGLFRFSTMAEAAAALDEIAANYERHAQAAREVAELFDAKRVAEAIVGR